jgi:hypothetical protein
MLTTSICDFMIKRCNVTNSTESFTFKLASDNRYDAFGNNYYLHIIDNEANKSMICKLKIFKKSKKIHLTVLGRDNDFIKSLVKDIQECFDFKIFIALRTEECEDKFEIYEYDESLLE